MTTLAARALFAIFSFLSHVGPVGANDGRCREPVGKDLSSASPVDVGLPSEQLLKLNQVLDVGKHDVRSLLIVRDCKIVFERYKVGIGREHNHTIYSVTKSITATLVGALLNQGKLRTIEAPISELVSKPWSYPEHNWKKTQRITLKNAMQMSSGLTYKHDPAGHPIYAERDRFAFALSPEFIAEPGTRFNYSDGDASITGAVVAAAADNDLYRFGREVLFDPLQMSNYAWWFRDQTGRYPGGWGLRLRPIDMAKVGQLYLQNGEWNGRRIFDANFRGLALAPGASKVYGLHWWIGSAPEAKGTSYYFAMGAKGQRIFVFPGLRVVAVLTASLPSVEERAVHGLIVGTLANAFAAGPDADASASLASLAEVQKRGFNGETRIPQRDQDIPRRF